MAPWKAPGSDGIPADLLRNYKSCLLPHLHDNLVRCWRDDVVPQDMCDAKIIILYKNKGSRLLQGKWTPEASRKSIP